MSGIFNNMLSSSTNEVFFAERLRALIHARWKNSIISRPLKVEGVDYGYFSADVVMKTIVDSGSDAYGIAVACPSSGDINVRIPVYLQMDRIMAGIGMIPASPMGIDACILVMAPLRHAGNVVTVQFSSAVVEMDRFGDVSGTAGRSFSYSDPGICPTGSFYGEDVANYRSNRRIFGPDLDALLMAHFISYGQDLAEDMGDIHLPVSPTDVSKILMEDEAADLIFLDRGDPGSPMHFRAPFLGILFDPEGSHELSKKAAAIKTLVFNCFDHLLMISHP